MKIVNLILLGKYSLREENFVENTFVETNFANFQQKCQIKFYKYIFDRNHSEKHGYFLVEPITKMHPANKSLYLGFEIRFSNFNKFHKQDFINIILFYFLLFCYSLLNSSTLEACQYS